MDHNENNFELSHPNNLSTKILELIINEIEMSKNT